MKNFVYSFHTPTWHRASSLQTRCLCAKTCALGRFAPNFQALIEYSSLVLVTFSSVFFVHSVLLVHGVRFSFIDPPLLYLSVLFLLRRIPKFHLRSSTTTSSPCARAQCGQRRRRVLFVQSRVAWMRVLWATTSSFISFLVLCFHSEGGMGTHLSCFLLWIE